MKVRAGFVSNSSSSSFIVALRGDKKLDVDTLVSLFRVPEDSPMYRIAVNMAQAMYNRANKHDEKEILYNWGYDTIEEAIEKGCKQAKLLKEGFTVYSGYASDEDGGIEAMLCNTEIDFESDDIVVYSEGGY